MAQVIESALFAIPLAGGVDKTEPARLTGTLRARPRAFKELRFERVGDVFREADTDEAPCRDSVA
jgi:hypothetical protein